MSAHEDDPMAHAAQRTAQAARSVAADPLDTGISPGIAGARPLPHSAAISGLGRAGATPDLPGIAEEPMPVGLGRAGVTGALAGVRDTNSDSGLGRGGMTPGDAAVRDSVGPSTGLGRGGLPDADDPAA